MSKPPPGTRTVPIKRIPPTSRDEIPSSGDETLPSGWTPRKATEVGGRGRREGTEGRRNDGTGESQEDCLNRVHAELEVNNKNFMLFFY